MRLVIWDAIARIMTSPWWIRMTGSLWGNLPTDFLNCLESPAIRQLVQQIVLSSKKETSKFLIAGPLWGVIHRWPVVSPLNWPVISKAICDFMSWRHHRTSIANGPFRAIHQCNFNIIKRCSAICQHDQALTLEYVWHIYATVNYTIIGSNSGLSPVRCHAIIWTNDGFMSFGRLETKFQWNFHKMRIVYLAQMQFENFVCKMAHILSWPQSINSLRPTDVAGHKICPLILRCWLMAAYRRLCYGWTIT